MMPGASGVMTLTRQHLNAGQRGAVLIVALVALILLSLSAVVLVRAIQDGGMFAGNLALRQAATQAAEVGLERAIQVVQGRTNRFDADDAARGYYARVVSFAAGAMPPAVRWVNQPCFDLEGQAVACGLAGVYHYQFVVERLCDAAPVTAPQDQCIGGGPVDTGSKKSSAPAPLTLASFHFRITVRVRGPRDVMSVVQSVVAL